MLLVLGTFQTGSQDSSLDLINVSEHRSLENESRRMKQIKLRIAIHTVIALVSAALVGVSINTLLTTQRGLYLAYVGLCVSLIGVVLSGKGLIDIIKLGNKVALQIERMVSVNGGMLSFAKPSTQYTMCLMMGTPLERYHGVIDIVSHSSGHRIGEIIVPRPWLWWWDNPTTGVATIIWRSPTESSSSGEQIDVIFRLLPIYVKGCLSTAYPLPAEETVTLLLFTKGVIGK